MKWIVAITALFVVGLGVGYYARQEAPKEQDPLEAVFAEAPESHDAVDSSEKLERDEVPDRAEESAPAAKGITPSKPAETARTARAESAETPERKAEIDAARKAQEPAMEDFLRGELKLSDEEMAAYKSLKQKHEQAMIARAKEAQAKEAEQAERRRPAGMGKLMREQRRELSDLLGRDRFARYQEYQRRQREELSIQFPELREMFEGRRRRGR
jgi:hypothetical protein